MASAGPYASLHLAPDRQPRQHPTTQFLQAGCPSCRPANSVKALKATWSTQLGWRTFMMTCLCWILGNMRLEIWRKIGPTGDWCLCTALRIWGGVCYYWIGLEYPAMLIFKSWCFMLSFHRRRCCPSSLACSMSLCLLPHTDQRVKFPLTWRVLCD